MTQETGVHEQSDMQTALPQASAAAACSIAPESTALVKEDADSNTGTPHLGLRVESGQDEGRIA